MAKLYVYGTLMKGAPATHLLSGYMMFSVKGAKFNFPVIQPWPYEGNGPTVSGCILEVDEDDLAVLDYYEGVSSGLYERIEVEVVPMEPSPPWQNSTETVQVYVGGPALVNEPIPNGVWST